MIDFNINTLVNEIKAQGQKNAQSENARLEREKRALIDRIGQINEKYAPLVEHLVTVFKALKANRMKYKGPSYGFMDSQFKFMADGIDHHLGFVEYQGQAWLEVIGGGYCGECRVALGYPHDTLKDALAVGYVSDRSNIIGDAIAIVEAKHGRSDWASYIHSLKERLDTIEKEFEEFHDAYIQYAQSQINK